MTDDPHILVVDDDRRLRDLLQRYLSDNGFRVTTAPDAAAARAVMASLAFDILVLDVMMPGESGVDLTASLRADNPVPILMLTAMDEPEDRIAGLESGADDYLAKPFEPRELLLRIRKILDRAPIPVHANGEVVFGDCRFALERQELSRGGARVRLTDSEARLLVALAERPGETVTREDLAADLGLDVSSRAVDVAVTRLRRKIEADPKDPRYLQTARGKGYLLLTDSAQ